MVWAQPGRASGLSWSSMAAWFEAVPPGVWVGVVVANLVLTVVTWSTASRRLRRAGRRVTDPTAARSGRAKDTALTLASLIPAGLFWLMVLGGSLHGLVAFGHDTLGWRGGWEYLVPGTLDGVSVTFAMLAFRAIRLGKVPDRSYRVVRGAAFASATINYFHEYGQSHNALAGGYLALLSLFGMVMFDEFLNQFEQGNAQVRRENPKFGARWFTWPTNTLLAWVAWRNHPPAEGTPGTVANAVANLNLVRAAKREARRRSQAGRQVPAVPPTRSVEPRRSEPRMPIGTTAAAAVRQPATASAGGASSDDDRGRPTVPTTAATLSRWIAVWVAMCEQPALAWSCMQDDALSREHFHLSGRLLRHVRHAATTGALRRRAEQLGVALPAGFNEMAGDAIRP